MPTSPEELAFNHVFTGPRRKRAGSVEAEEAPAKRKRQASEPPADAPIEPDYTLLDNYTSVFKQFDITNHVTRFVMKNTRKSVEDAEENIRRLFARFIQNAVTFAEKEGKQANDIQVIIDGPWAGNSIIIPPRSRDQNTVEAIFNEYQRQGASAAGSKHALYNSEVKVTVTTIQSHVGGYRRRVHVLNHYGVDEEFRLPVHNEGNNFCMFYALELVRIYTDHFLINELKAKGEQVPNRLMNYYHWNRYVRNDSAVQHANAVELMEAAGIPLDLDAYGYEHLAAVQEYYDTVYPHMYRIVAFDSNLQLKPFFKGGDRRKQFDLPIFLQDGHYDAILKINKFFKLRNYCVDCEISYSNANSHRKSCEARCYYCAGIGPSFPCEPEDGVTICCTACNRDFYSQRCYDWHKRDMCNRYKRCLTCKRVYQKTQYPHKCGDGYCRTCKCLHSPARGCWIPTIEPAEEEDEIRMISFDLECSQDLVVQEGVTEHRPNFISARVTCSLCEGDDVPDCRICGAERHKTFSALEGINPIEKFVEWILTAFDNRYNTIAWAHYAGRYDNHFVLQELSRLNLRPKMAMEGLKIFEMVVRGDKQYSQITFRDSWLLMNVKLAKLKETFDLDVDNKLYFPHLYNKAANYTKSRNCLPRFRDYCPDSMSKEDRRAFKMWYRQNKNTPFRLKDALGEYCANDTEILQAAILEMRSILLDLTKGYDVMRYASTIAGISMRIYKSMFLQEEHISIVPERGYERNDRASKIAINYFNWLMHQDPNLEIRHAGNGREKILFRPPPHKPYKLDAYIAAENRAIEFQGCEFHGCPRCFEGRMQTMCANHRSAQDNYNASRVRLDFIRRQGVEIEEVWECTVREQMAANREMKQWFEQQPDTAWIDPRMGFSGGRTGPRALYAKAGGGKKLAVMDIISLYPYINYTTSYPVGVPTIVYPTAHDVHWTSPEDIHHYAGRRIRGLLKVRLLAPQNRRLLVVPVKVDDRLLFCSCAACARAFKVACTRTDHVCRHTPEQRKFVSVVTSLELEEALRSGYVVDKFYRAWHYTQWDSNLFKGYVRTFLKLKVEATGWAKNIPDLAACQNEEERQSMKEAFCDEYRRRYEMDIDPDRVSSNPGLRHIAKLCLNSLWGKFAMRNLLTKTEVFTRPSEFYKRYHDRRNKVGMVIPLSQSAMRLVYKEKEDFIMEHNNSNIVIALWTTSAARLHLLKYMRQVDNAPGAMLLYTDTDSVIYVYSGRNPIVPGQFLGDMSAEYEDFRILEFACAGAKQYGLKLRDKRTLRIKHVLKIRGITLDYDACQHFQYERFKQMVLSYGNGDTEPFHYHKFGPQQNSRILSKELCKRYRALCQKGIIDDETWNLYDFGYLGPGVDYYISQ